MMTRLVTANPLKTQQKTPFVINVIKSPTRSSRAETENYQRCLLASSRVADWAATRLALAMVWT